MSFEYSWFTSCKLLYTYNVDKIINLEICTYLYFILRKQFDPQPLVVQIFPVIDSVVLDERHDMLHPCGTALRVACNEHVARFSDEAAPHLLERFQGHSRGEKDLFSTGWLGHFEPFPGHLLCLGCMFQQLGSCRR